MAAGNSAIQRKYALSLVSDRHLDVVTGALFSGFRFFVY